MKTKTSRKTIWARSLLLLPLMALLFYGFSDKAVVVKDGVNTLNTIQDTIPDKKLTLHIEEEIIIVNGKITKLKDFAKTVNEITSDWTKKDFEFHGLEIQVADGVENTFIDKINAEFKKTDLAKASVSNSPYIPYSRSLTSNIPDTPPAPSKMENYLTDNSKIYLEGKLISTEEAIELINTRRDELTVSILENGKNKPIITMEFKSAIAPTPPPLPPAPEAKTIEKQPMSKKVNGNQIILLPIPPVNESVIITVVEDAPPPPQPPAPPAPPSFEGLVADGAVFYYNGKIIAPEIARNLVEVQKRVNVQITYTDEEKPTVKLTDKKDKD